MAPLYHTRQLGVDVLRSAEEIVTRQMGYYRLFLGIRVIGYVIEWVPSGDPSTDMDAWKAGADGAQLPLWGGRKIITPPQTDPPPVGTINWESFNESEFANSSLPVTIAGRNFRNEDPSRSMIRNWNRRYIFNKCRFDSITPVIEGFGINAEYRDCSMATRRPTVYGQGAPYLISAQEMKHLVLENSDFPYMGKGFYFGGKAGKFNGDRTVGDGLYLRRLRLRNPDGRRSDGAGKYIKSGLGQAHYNNNVGNVQNTGGVVGFDIAHMQLAQMPGAIISIEDLELLCDLNLSRVEDVLAAYGGAGGWPGRLAYILRCYLENSGGYDWNYEEGVSTSYNVGNQITLNATGPQVPSETIYSGTSTMIGDEGRANYLDNSCYWVVKDNVTAGATGRMNMFHGHHNTYENNEIHAHDRHRSGVPYSGYHDGYFQISNWDYDRQATDTGELIWGYHEFWNQQLLRGNGPDGEAFTIGAIDINGGNQGGNVKRVLDRDGGVARLARWRADQVAAGRTIGRLTDREVLS